MSTTGRGKSTTKIHSAGTRQLRLVTVPNPEPTSPEEKIVVGFLHALTSCRIIGDWEWYFTSSADAAKTQSITFKPWRASHE